MQINNNRNKIIIKTKLTVCAIPGAICQDGGLDYFLP